jgi:cephalosporin hydroxylase
MESILEEVDSFVRAKMRKQNGVPTFYDNRMMKLIGAVRSAETAADRGSELVSAAVREIEVYHSLIRKPRFEEPGVRLGRSEDVLRKSMKPGFRSLFASQGVRSAPSWSGRLLFKTAFDCVIYPMLIAELAPKTIIELGSADGGSAVWMADVARAHGQEPRILSIDLEPVEVQDERVEFRRGDVFDIAHVLAPEELAGLEHPWLIIEDAHVNVRNVLTHLDGSIEPGDYLVVEDSYAKRPALREFLREAQNTYMLDLAYLDMFGENSTCAMDSIFVAVEPAVHRNDVSL